MVKVKYLLAFAIMVSVFGCAPKSQLDEKAFNDLEVMVNQKFVDPEYKQYFDSHKFKLTKIRTVDIERLGEGSVEKGLVRGTYIYIERDVNDSFEALRLFEKEKMLKDLVRGLASSRGKECGRNFSHACFLKGVALHSENRTFAMEWEPKKDEFKMEITD
ncbi:hypothetical protein [Halobacillus salinus]|uniref:Lipoprotein n=1 Tax=Halobacillus salinus TaxID=192814 RepID=A0A4Z0H4U1_9BACI|nr:hypothetical protein [Halobacillus salinus]TGB04934.1 hypothetical protein E4663_08050 [Halobacillus salinus]